MNEFRKKIEVQVKELSEIDLEMKFTIEYLRGMKFYLDSKIVKECLREDRSDIYSYIERVNTALECDIFKTDIFKILKKFNENSNYFYYSGDLFVARELMISIIDELQNPQTNQVRRMIKEEGIGKEPGE